MEWVIFVLALVIVIVALTRSGWARGVRDPVTFVAVALSCGSLNAALDEPLASTPGAVLFTVEIVATIYVFYLFWRRVHPSDRGAT